MTPAFEEAMALLAQEPLPSDIEARLEALEKQVDPEERERFGDLWEALRASQTDTEAFGG